MTEDGKKILEQIKADSASIAESALILEQIKADSAMEA